MPFVTLSNENRIYYELTGPEDGPIVMQFGGSLFGRHNFGFVNDGFRERAQADRMPMAWIALDGEIPVATASLMAVERPDDEVGPWVGGVFVIPSYRGQGLAVRLMHALAAPRHGDRCTEHADGNGRATLEARPQPSCLRRATLHLKRRRAVTLAQEVLVATRRGWQADEGE